MVEELLEKKPRAELEKVAVSMSDNAAWSQAIAQGTALKKPAQKPIYNAQAASARAVQAQQGLPSRTFTAGRYGTARNIPGGAEATVATLPGPVHGAAPTARAFPGYDPSTAYTPGQGGIPRLAVRDGEGGFAELAGVPGALPARREVENKISRWNLSQRNNPNEIAQHLRARARWSESEGQDPARLKREQDASWGAINRLTGGALAGSFTISPEDRYSGHTEATGRAPGSRFVDHTDSIFGGTAAIAAGQKYGKHLATKLPAYRAAAATGTRAAALRAGAAGVGAKALTGAAGLGAPFIAQQLLAPALDDLSGYDPRDLQARGQLTTPSQKRDIAAGGYMSVAGLNPKMVDAAVAGYPSGAIMPQNWADRFPGLTTGIANIAGGPYKLPSGTEITPQSLGSGMQSMLNEWNKANVDPRNEQRAGHREQEGRLVSSLVSAGSGIEGGLSSEQATKLVASGNVERLAEYGVGRDPVDPSKPAVGGINPRLNYSTGEPNPGYVKPEHTNGFNFFMGSGAGKQLLGGKARETGAGVFELTPRVLNELGVAYNKQREATTAVDSSGEWNTTVAENMARAKDTNADVYMTQGANGKPMISLSRSIFGASNQYQNPQSFKGEGGEPTGLEGALVGKAGIMNQMIREQGAANLREPGDSHNGWSMEFKDKRFDGAGPSAGYVLRDHKQDPLVAKMQETNGHAGLFGVLGDGGKILGKDGTQHDMDKVPQEVEQYWRGALNEESPQNTKRFKRLALLEAYRGNEYNWDTKQFAPYAEGAPRAGGGFNAVGDLLMENRNGMYQELERTLGPEEARQFQSGHPPWQPGSTASVFRLPGSPDELAKRGLSLKENDYHSAVAVDAGGNSVWTSVLGENAPKFGAKDPETGLATGIIPSQTAR